MLPALPTSTSVSNLGYHRKDGKSGKMLAIGLRNDVLSVRFSIPVSANEQGKRTGMDTRERRFQFPDGAVGKSSNPVY